MSRRKQAKPSRRDDLSDDDLSDHKGNNNATSITGNAKSNNNALNEIKTHPNNTTTNTTTNTTAEEAVIEDANNNEKQKDEEEEQILKHKNADAIRSLIANLQWPATSPTVTLEALQNTKVAVAQLAASALNGDSSENFVALQSTLQVLQQQQLLQLQLISQLQSQLHVSEEGSEDEDLPPALPSSKSQQHQHHHEEKEDDEQQEEEEEMRQSRCSKENNITSTAAAVPSSALEEDEIEEKITSLGNNGGGGGGGGPGGLNPAFASLLNCPNQDPNRPLSPGLQSHHQINNNHLNQTDGPPSTLEMLQKRAQEVLDSASQGLLQSSLCSSDDPRSKKLGPYDKSREPFFKHRCRYCGKVFGSDSALQIHIRSHTGERPFKCNVCGSRFTTKGNLKVHFQRHTSKFPHIKMNPHPVPEHLDHFHPPLISNTNSSSPTSPPSHSPIPPPPHHAAPHPHPNFLHHSPFFNPLFRFDATKPVVPLPVFNSQLSDNSTKEEPLSPQDLTKPKIVLKDEIMKKEECEDAESPKLEEDDDDEEMIDEEPKQENNKCDQQQNHEEREIKQENEESDEEDECDQGQFEESDQPENLSSKSLPLMYPLPLMARPSRSSSANSNHPPRPPSSNSPQQRFHHHMQHLQHKMQFDPAKDPAIYTNLLPRPGSNDNAWESLIEVTKTSETSKLQQLVDNIEHKLTDPNQCIICHRVLSCKSALQMHYRTHTGERPFRCKICGRAFTTKGNLKTHMGVHRAKPPLRVLHQCPVCHKRFTNSLVLQQHIRLHTGEPTDLTPDQIRAAEVKDTFQFSPFPHHQSYLDDDTTNSETNESEEPQQLTVDIKPSTSLAALENQVRTITTTANFSSINSPKAHSQNNHSLSPSSSSCGSPPPQSLPNHSQGGGGSNALALDLTPRSTSNNSNNVNSIFNPFLGHLPPPPPPFPPSLLTPTSNSVAAAAALANLSFNPVIVPPPRLENESFLWTANRGNTTCHICLKTFACNSALEIHYRSHTKERPYRCGVCDRGFSTKGNKKQHELTHSREMRATRDATSNSSFESNKNGQTSNDESKSPPPPLPLPPMSPASVGNSNSNHKRPASSPPPCSPPPPKKHAIVNNIEGLQSSEDKHLCKVCSKSFSSSSALQIHMRIHTGSKPYVCEVCQKAFTTKGNLKVHMGTHSWTSGQSRRGRRMSLDPMTVFLPHHQLQQTILGTTIKSDRPELFYFNNSNAQQQAIFHHNGSLKPTTTEDEEGNDDESQQLTRIEKTISLKSNGESEKKDEKANGHCIKEEEEDA